MIQPAGVLRIGRLQWRQMLVSPPRPLNSVCLRDRRCTPIMHLARSMSLWNIAISPGRNVTADVAPAIKFSFMQVSKWNIGSRRFAGKIADGCCLPRLGSRHILAVPGAGRRACMDRVCAAFRHGRAVFGAGERRGLRAADGRLVVADRQGPPHPQHRDRLVRATAVARYAGPEPDEACRIMGDLDGDRGDLWHRALLWQRNFAFAMWCFTNAASIRFVASISYVLWIGAGDVADGGGQRGLFLAREDRGAAFEARSGLPCVFRVDDAQRVRTAVVCKAAGLIPLPFTGGG
jgi:hypothetical protein